MPPSPIPLLLIDHYAPLQVVYVNIKWPRPLNINCLWRHVSDVSFSPSAPNQLARLKLLTSQWGAAKKKSLSIAFAPTQLQQYYAESVSSTCPLPDTRTARINTGMQTQEISGVPPHSNSVMRYNTYYYPTPYMAEKCIHICLASAVGRVVLILTVYHDRCPLLNRHDTILSCSSACSLALINFQNGDAH